MINWTVYVLCTCAINLLTTKLSRVTITWGNIQSKISLVQYLCRKENHLIILHKYWVMQKCLMLVHLTLLKSLTDGFELWGAKPLAKSQGKVQEAQGVCWHHCGIDWLQISLLWSTCSVWVMVEAWMKLGERSSLLFLEELLTCCWAAEAESRRSKQSHFLFIQCPGSANDAMHWCTHCSWVERLVNVTSHKV